MNQKILIVDDDVLFLKLVEKFFKDWNMPFEVILESSVTNAIEYIESNAKEIDLVVTDYHMPEMNGIEFTGECKKLLNETPVVLLTANKDRKVALAAIKKGVFDFIEKPFDNEEFQTVINRALEFSKLTKERVILMERLRRGGKEILRLSKELNHSEETEEAS